MSGFGALHLDLITEFQSTSSEEDVVSVYTAVKVTYNEFQSTSSEEDVVSASR